MNHIEITALNSPYTLDFAAIQATGNVTANQIFVKSSGAANTLILGALSGVEGLPKVTIVVASNSLSVRTTGTDQAAGGGLCSKGVNSGIVASLATGCAAEITKFISPSQSYWVIK